MGTVNWELGTETVLYSLFPVLLMLDTGYLQLINRKMCLEADND